MVVNRLTDSAVTTIASVVTHNLNFKILKDIVLNFDA